MDLFATLVDRSPAGIAAVVGAAIRSGHLAPGDRLPTVREVALELGLSPATVSGAWRALGEASLVQARGRAGTFVLPQRTSWLPPRYQDLAQGTQTPYRIDVSTGTPDPQLLPSVGRAFARLGRRTEGAATSTYLGQPVLAPLEKRLRAAWPFPPEALTVVDGAMDGLARTLEVLVARGSSVAVEDPGFPPFFDLLDALGTRRVPVTLDAEGMMPSSLRAALDAGCDVVLLQPRAQNPTGTTLTAERVRELAQVITRHRRGAEVMVVEDDHSGAVCQTPETSLGLLLPGQVVHVHSYSKSHGPDLRIAAVGGPRRVVEPLVARRMLGPGWTSRMLQEVLLDLLHDQASRDQVRDAREAYLTRQRLLARAMQAGGVDVTPGEGLNMWVPVADERAALVHLAAQGVRAAPGGPFRAWAPGGAGGSSWSGGSSGSGGTGGADVPDDPCAAGIDRSGGTPRGADDGLGARRPGHLRVSVGLVRDSYEQLGTLLAAAAHC